MYLQPCVKTQQQKAAELPTLSLLQNIHCIDILKLKSDAALKLREEPVNKKKNICLVYIRMSSYELISNYRFYFSLISFYLPLTDLLLCFVHRKSSHILIGI